MATHGVLAGDAEALLEKAPIDEILITNSIQSPKKSTMTKLHRISIAPLLADAILKIVR